MPLEWVVGKFRSITATETATETATSSCIADATGDIAANRVAGTEWQQDISSTGASSADAASTGVTVDPSLLVEGLPWCADLTVPDPLIILPTITCLLIASNIISRPLNQPPLKRLLSVKQLPPGLPADSPQGQALVNPQRPVGVQRYIFKNINNLQRVGLSILIPFWMLMTQFPAGIVLYLCSSVATGWAQRRWLDYKIPHLPEIRPCARPLRTKPREVAGRWSASLRE